MERLPRLIVVGASGFVGRRLLEAVRTRFRIFAVARRSQAECGAPLHPNISWHQIDIVDRLSVEELFASIRRGGGADAVLHLAAFYDFTGEDHREYWDVNVEGLRNVLECSKGLGLRRFVFASSVAACGFPRPGTALDEASPPDGDHVYAATKRIGEAMLEEYREDFPSSIVRFAALFSDWCEYLPLFFFLDTWLSQRWNARVLGGRGRSAVPYLHVRDAAEFLWRVLARMDDWLPGEVLIASPDGATSHRELFEAATSYYFGAERRPVLMPRLLASPGIRARDALGRVLGERPFERPWMARYIDLALRVDARRTRERLGWAPRPRLEVLARIPFLLENLKTDPVEFYRRNREAMLARKLRPNLRIAQRLEARAESIFTAFTAALEGAARDGRAPHYAQIAPEDHVWHHRLILRSLVNSVRRRERGVFMAYCRDLAERRFGQGFELAEMVFALETFNRVCLEALRGGPEAPELAGAFHDAVTVTIEFGADSVADVYETLRGAGGDLPLSNLRAQLWRYPRGHGDAPAAEGADLGEPGVG